MDPQEQRLELEAAVAGDHDLAVEDAALRQGRLERRVELREVAIERLEVPGLDVGLVAVPEDERPEAVPLRLVEPASPSGRPSAGLASIGSIGGSKGSFTAATVPGNADVMRAGARSRLRRRWHMPARTEKQRKFMGAELQRKREGKKTRTGMSESELEKMASKPEARRRRSRLAGPRGRPAGIDRRAGLC